MGKGLFTTSGNRIETIDVLRGFALAGILYAHMVFWYTGAALPPEVYFNYDGTANGIALGIFGALVFGKFFSVFSFLFGLGFFLHFRKNKSDGGNLTVYIWRMFLLFIIGIMHHLVWRGDILAIYAVLGIFLLFFRRLPYKLLFLISILLITNLPTHIYEAFGSQNLISEINFPMAAEAEKYYSLVKDGDFVTVLKENWNSWPAKIRYQFESGRLLMTFGYFLLGFYAGRRGLFNNIEKNLWRIKKWNKWTEKVVLILLVAGGLMYIMDYVTLPELKVVPELQWLASFLFSIYNACLTIFYISGVTLLYRLKIFHNILKPLAAVGRMALTNYLLQTVFGLLIYYKFGLGLFDKTSLAVNVLIAVVVFYLQLKFSQLWLKHFKQGPVEWLWRGLSYLKFSSNKKQIAEKSESVISREV